jgi:ketose-bisphosphate aldolase
MMQPIVQAAVDQDSFVIVSVARLEWLKFESKSPAAVMAEFAKYGQPEHTSLHLDHIPVIDEDGQRVDYLPIIREALTLGYHSVMLDGSRLPLAENIACTRQVVEMAHDVGVPCEGELGAVLGHESGPLPPYEELFASGKGFTDVGEAGCFVRETRCDWLSVAIGNLHGAVAGVAKDQKKVQARLNLEHLSRLCEATGIPLVLHGGSGIQADDLKKAIRIGIAKINIATETRQAYERTLRGTGNIPAAQDAVYERAVWVIRDFLGCAGTQRVIKGKEVPFVAAD